MPDLGGFAEPGCAPLVDGLASTLDNGDLGPGGVISVNGPDVVVDIGWRGAQGDGSVVAAAQERVDR